MIRFRHALALVLVATAAPVFAQSLTPDQTQAIDALVASSLKSSGVPSASIAVVRDGKLVYAKAYGDQGPNIPGPSAQAKYQIASVSKQFTAAAILLLEDQGKLSLDDTVSKYVPDVTGGDRITIRQLLSHTSGLQDYWPQDYSFAAMEQPTTPQAIVDRWAKKPLDFEPGSQWQYSNTGYVVAGMIVEKVSGQKLLDFLQQRIFQPLGIDAVDQDLAVGPGYPTGYHRYGLGPVRAEKPAASGWLWAAGELAMSPSDLAKWDIARMNRSLLPTDDWQAQETEVKLTSGAGSHYGLGVFLRPLNGHRAVFHGGEAVGFLTENDVFPDEKTAVVVAVNADFGDAHGTIAEGIEKLILPPAPEQAATPAAKPAAAAPADPAEEARTELARATYAALQKGTPNLDQMTEDARYYFTPEAIADYRDSLGPLGTPKSFVPAGPPRLRGGFVNRNYVISYKDRKLVAVTYAEPGADGKFEQFLVMPAQ